MVTQEFLDSVPGTIAALFAILDEHKPGWVDDIDIEALDFADPDNDVPAQTGTQELFRDRQTALACGVLVPEDHHDSLLLEEGAAKYRCLEAVAVQEILKRRRTKPPKKDNLERDERDMRQAILLGWSAWPIGFAPPYAF